MFVRNGFEKKMINGSDYSNMFCFYMFFYLKFWGFFLELVGR